MRTHTEDVVCPNCGQEVEVEFKEYHTGRCMEHDGDCPKCDYRIDWYEVETVPCDCCGKRVKPTDMIKVGKELSCRACFEEFGHHWKLPEPEAEHYVEVVGDLPKCKCGFDFNAPKNEWCGLASQVNPTKEDHVFEVIYQCGNCGKEYRRYERREQ